MTRWWRWALGFAALVAVGVTILLLATEPGAPFEFLQGNQPLKTQATKRRLPVGTERLVYSFKGDFKTVLKRAGPELLREGYVDTNVRASHTRTAIFFKENRSASARRPFPSIASVAILNDVRMYDQADPQANTSLAQAGWVTVIIEGREDKTFLDKLLARLGL